MKIISVVTTSNAHVTGMTEFTRNSQLVVLRPRVLGYGSGSGRKDVELYGLVLNEIKHLLTNGKVSQVCCGH